MRIVWGLAAYPADVGPCVVAQGTFDGIHRGHQQVVRTAVERATDLGVLPVALTFDPLPAAVLRPTEAPAMIVPLEERLSLLAGLGVAATLVVAFTPEFSHVEADRFVRDVLIGLLRAREVVVGFNHTFGRGARGTPALLRTEAEPRGVRVHVVPPLSVGGVVVSSSSVREALRRGDVRLVAELLGRPYVLRGTVGRGAERGRVLGFPTANLELPGAGGLGNGVYAARVSWEGRTAGAVVNVGTRPTFGGAARLAEAHLLEVTVDLYGRQLAVAFVDRIREEIRFPSVEALRARIAEDVSAARRLLASPPPGLPGPVPER